MNAAGNAPWWKIAIVTCANGEKLVTLSVAELCVSFGRAGRAVLDDETSYLEVQFEQAELDELVSMLVVARGEAWTTTPS